jgi:hypothetical protein
MRNWLLGLPELILWEQSPKKMMNTLLTLLFACLAFFGLGEFGLFHWEDGCFVTQSLDLFTPPPSPQRQEPEMKIPLFRLQSLLDARLNWKCDNKAFLLMPTHSTSFLWAVTRNFPYIKFCHIFIKIIINSWMWHGKRHILKKPQLQKPTNLNALLEHIWPQVTALKLCLKCQPLKFPMYVVLLEIKISTQGNLKAAHHNIFFFRNKSRLIKEHQLAVWNVIRIWQHTWPLRCVTQKMSK